jgi:hypothetical protein
MKYRPLWVTSLICLGIVLLSGCVEAMPKPSQAAWPTRGWQTSLPEPQGMDSGQLVKMMDYIVSRKLNLHSLLIERNGYLVTEVYYFPVPTGYAAEHLFLYQEFYIYSDRYSYG